MGLRVQREGVQAGPLEWVLRLADGGSYVIRSDGNEWTVEPGEVENPDVLVTATKETWARFLANDPPTRSPAHSGIDIAGARSAVQIFLNALEVFPFGSHPGDLVPSTSSRR